MAAKSIASETRSGANTPPDGQEQLATIDELAARSRYSGAGVEAAPAFKIRRHSPTASRGPLRVAGAPATRQRPQWD